MGVRFLEIKKCKQSIWRQGILRTLPISSTDLKRQTHRQECYGKTTLLNIITGLTEPDTGTVERGETIVFGYYRQQVLNFDNDMMLLMQLKT